jgi:hypothetical protein
LFQDELWFRSPATVPYPAGGPDQRHVLPHAEFVTAARHYDSGTKCYTGLEQQQNGQWR